VKAVGDVISTIYHNVDEIEIPDISPDVKVNEKSEKIVTVLM